MTVAIYGKTVKHRISKSLDTVVVRIKKATDEMNNKEKGEMWVFLFRYAQALSFVGFPCLFPPSYSFAAVKQNVF
jgi:hypothetical protein